MWEAFIFDLGYLSLKIVDFQNLLIDSIRFDSTLLCHRYPVIWDDVSLGYSTLSTFYCDMLTSPWWDILCEYVWYLVNWAMNQRV